ncbi:MAG: prepilin-type N-terminal cleavage/methylation domain-containing protein [Verrucomicrobiota bacterium]
MSWRRQRRSAAFTLVELLVVIVVLAVLITLSLMAMGQVLTSAATTHAQNNLRQLAVANLAYAADHGTYCPAQSRDNNTRWHGSRSGSSEAWDPHGGYLAPYMRDGHYLQLCPLLEGHENTPTFEEGAGGYGYNAAYIGGRLNPANGRWDYSTPNRPSGVPNPSQTIMFTTTAFARAGGVQEYPYSEPPMEAGGRFALQPSTHFRASNDRAVVAWCDGRVSLEERNDSSGPDYYGGNSEEAEVGWFGPMEHNGYWNPRYQELAARNASD